MVLSNHSKKIALNQADNISIFQLCLLLKMRLSVDLEGRFTGYKHLKNLKRVKTFKVKTFFIDHRLTTTICKKQ